MNFTTILKFIYSEKATKFCEIFTLFLSFVVLGEDFAKFCDLLRIYELYPKYKFRVLIQEMHKRDNMHQKQQLGQVFLGPHTPTGMKRCKFVFKKPLAYAPAAPCAGHLFRVHEPLHFRLLHTAAVEIAPFFLSVS